MFFCSFVYDMTNLFMIWSVSPGSAESWLAIIGLTLLLIPADLMVQLRLVKQGITILSSLFLHEVGTFFLVKCQEEHKGSGGKVPVC
jgi:hypothetical protein